MPALPHALMSSLLFAVVAGAGCLWLLPTEADKGAAGAGFVLPGRATYAVGALCFLAMMTEGAVIDWSALHLKDRLSLSAGSAASGFAAFSATMALGRFFGDRLRSRLSAARLVRASASLAAAGLFVALLAPWPAVAVAGFAIVGLGLSNLVPIFFSAAARIPGQPSGAAIAAVATLGYGGFLVGPPVIGAVAEMTSLTLALGSTVLAAIVIALAATTTVAPPRKAPDTASVGGSPP
jgi:fucose permease